MGRDSEREGSKTYATIIMASESLIEKKRLTRALNSPNNKDRDKGRGH